MNLKKLRNKMFFYLIILVILLYFIYIFFYPIKKAKLLRPIGYYEVGYFSDITGFPWILKEKGKEEQIILLGNIPNLYFSEHLLAGSGSGNIFYISGYFLKEKIEVEGEQFRILISTKWEIKAPIRRDVIINIFPRRWLVPYDILSKSKIIKQIKSRKERNILY